MAEIETAQRARAGAVLAEGIIDCDVHPLMLEGVPGLMPYMSESWRRRFEPRQMTALSSMPPGRTPNPKGPDGNLRGDAVPPSGAPPGTDIEFMKADWLDRFNVSRALLLPIQATVASIATDGDEAAVLAAAYNDYFREHWAAADQRFRLAIVVAPQDPAKAAAEIRRFASDPAVAAIWVPPLNILLGNRHYHPILAAADEAGLPIVLHPSGWDGNFVGAPLFAGGIPASYTERYCSLSQMAIGHLSSLIFEGALERFPNLRIVFTEYGWTWVPAQVWRMDAAWQGLRIDVPWVKRRPSEYVMERVRFTSEPAIEVPNERYLTQALEMIGAERTLVFSSDYPHWDADDPTLVFRGLPADQQRRIFRDSARETFGERLA
jgi:predicted TIM-barrel fold metal-dependent hydrolase